MVVDPHLEADGTAPYSIPSAHRTPSSVTGAVQAVTSRGPWPTHHTPLLFGPSMALGQCATVRLRPKRGMLTKCQFTILTRSSRDSL